MIDLHVHSSESDGCLAPEELVVAARQSGLEALAIADHDTLAGYERARVRAQEIGLDLVCAVEISAQFGKSRTSRRRSTHLLGYFPLDPPGETFRSWLGELQARRQRRNERLAQRLQELGFEVTLQEASAPARKLVGRVHFARVLLQKGYVNSVAEAFRLYLGEGGKAYTPAEKVGLLEAMARVREAGGLPCLAHPGRLTWDVGEVLGELCTAGLLGLEAYSSEHSPAQTALFIQMARSHGLLITGGSDFHGDGKPGVRLGTGVNGNLCVPRWVLEQLRAAASGKP